MSWLKKQDFLRRTDYRKKGYIHYPKDKDSDTSLHDAIAGNKQLKEKNKREMRKLLKSL